MFVRVASKLVCVSIISGSAAVALAQVQPPRGNQPTNVAPQGGLRQPSGVVQASGTEQPGAARPVAPQMQPMQQPNQGQPNSNARTVQAGGMPLNVVPQNGAATVQPTGGANPRAQMLPGGAPVQPQVLNAAPPFQLTPDQEADLGRLLADWEKQSDKVQSLECGFTRLEYNPAFAPNGDPKIPTTECHGELKYAAPDKGLFRVTSTFVPDKTGKMVKSEIDLGEYWTCDGNSIFIVDHKEKLIIEKPLPPGMRGKAITEGPLPFVFGAKAEALKKRYYMRIITPQNSANEQVWLEARPKMQKDAANFSSVEIILSKPTLQPVGIQIYNPGANAAAQSRTTILLESPSVNSAMAKIAGWITNFAQPKIFGYKHVLQDDNAPPAASPVADGAKGAAMPAAQAQKPAEPRR